MTKKSLRCVILAVHCANVHPDSYRPQASAIQSRTVAEPPSHGQLVGQTEAQDKPSALLLFPSSRQHLCRGSCMPFDAFGREAVDALSTL